MKSLRHLRRFEALPIRKRYDVATQDKEKVYPQVKLSNDFRNQARSGLKNRVIFKDVVNHYQAGCDTPEWRERITSGAEGRRLFAHAGTNGDPVQDDRNISGS